MMKIMYEAPCKVPVILVRFW